MGSTPFQLTRRRPFVRVLSFLAGLAAMVCVAIISQAHMARPQELVNTYRDRILTRDGTIDLKYDEKVRVVVPYFVPWCAGKWHTWAI